MFDGIVEGKRFPLNPLSRFPAHAEPAVWRHDQGKVNDCSRIGYTGMGRNVRVGRKDGKKSTRGTVCQIGQRKPIKQCCRFRTGLARALIAMTISPKV